MKRLFIFSIYGLLAILNTAFCEAQISTNVPVSDPVYKAIDLFVAHDLIDPVVMGHRPYDRIKITDLILQSNQSLGNIKQSGNESVRLPSEMMRYLDEQLKYWMRVYALDLTSFEAMEPSILLKSVTYDLGVSSAETRSIKNDTKMGSIDAAVATLDANKSGRSYRKGLTTYTDFLLEMRISPFMALRMEPQVELSSIYEGRNLLKISPLRAYSRFGNRKLSIQIGRDELSWGQGEFGGLLISSNARPLDMIKIENPNAWHLPWLFSLVGPTRFTVFAANLGPERALKYAYLYGGKITIKPWKSLELGMGQTITIGGNGGPDFSLVDAFTEFFPVHKIARNSKFRDVGDHLFGFFDLRWTIPELRNAAFYWESTFDDSPARAIPRPGNLMNQMNIHTGLYFPRINATGSVSMRLEYQHTAPWAYRHGRWSSGNTLNRRIIGSALGPDAEGLYAVIRYVPEPGISGTVRVSYEYYRNDIYLNDGEATEKVLLETDREDESRYRMHLETTWRPSLKYSVDLASAIEYIDQYNFLPGKSRIDARINVSTSYTF